MEELLHALSPYTLHRSIKKGSTLLYQGEIPREAHIVRKGFIRVFTIVPSGDERTIALHTKGDIFPLSWVFGETKNTLFYYEAGSDLQLACVPKQQLLATINASPEHMATVLQSVINDHTALLMRITALEQSNAADKIALTLYYLLIRYGVERKPGIFTIKIRLTQAIVASLVGLTRESTAIHIASLKKAKVITYSHFTYVIDKAKLEKHIGEDNFKDLLLK